MPIVTKAAGIVPSDFNGFTVTSDGVVIIGDNISVTGWKNREKLFSFPVAFNADYALSVNQDNNIVIYTEKAKFVFSEDGTPLTFTKNDSVDIEDLQNRKVITLNENTSYVLTNRFGVINSVIKVQNGTQSTEYKTPASVVFVEFAFWEGNLILIVASFAMLLDIRKRRFVKPKATENSEITDTTTQKPKIEFELPKFLKAFQKPETYNKGAAFSSEYSSKPGERPKFLDDEKTKTNDEKTTETNNENADNK